MKKQGRNDPCHCGSGKKFKVCHGEVTSNFNQQWVIAGIIGGIFLLFFFMDSGSSTTTITNSAIPTSVIPQARTGSYAQPPSEVPVNELKLGAPSLTRLHSFANRTSGAILVWWIR